MRKKVPTNTTNYTVGYGCPPKHAQFRPVNPAILGDGRRAERTRSRCSGVLPKKK